ncbi:MAG TPA: iron-containing redox enzyme family protein [Baekduia sp.]|nr:iron-containing redox enzyme family protein [Baekduia sp.]
MQQLPDARGPLTAALTAALAEAPHDVPAPDPVSLAPADPLADDDLHLALYLLYELHYRGLPGVDERWEWHPPLLAFRAALEEVFEDGLTLALADWEAPPADARTMDLALRSVEAEDDGPSLSRHLETQGTLEQLREFLAHRSAYQLKEADPHSWAIPRLSGPPKAALVEVQADEYGGGRPERVHAALFADTLRAVGLADRYGAYVDHLPGVTLATVNLMSLCGLHRRLRGAIVGHLALFEMTSSLPNGRYGRAIRRLGFQPGPATEFFDEHVAADAVHENIAAVDLAGGFVRLEPDLTRQVLWGARALLELEGRWARHLLASWEAGRSSLRRPLGGTRGGEADRLVGAVAEGA